MTTMTIHVDEEVSGVDSLAQQFLALTDWPFSLLRQLNILIMMKIMMIIMMIMITMGITMKMIMRTKIIRHEENDHDDVDRYRW